MRKSTRIVKRLLAIFLIVLMSINTFGAVVSDNDGSAFITKAEFDSLKNDFQSQIDQYNTSIDAKIDGAISSYLAGINVAKETQLIDIYNTYTLNGKRLGWWSGERLNVNLYQRATLPNVLSGWIASYRYGGSTETTWNTSIGRWHKVWPFNTTWRDPDSAPDDAVGREFSWPTGTRIKDFIYATASNADKDAVPTLCYDTNNRIKYIKKCYTKLYIRMMAGGESYSDWPGALTNIDQWTGQHFFNNSFRWAALRAETVEGDADDLYLYPFVSASEWGIIRGANVWSSRAGGPNSSTGIYIFGTVDDTMPHEVAFRLVNIPRMYIGEGLGSSSQRRVIKDFSYADLYAVSQTNSVPIKYGVYVGEMTNNGKLKLTFNVDKSGEFWVRASSNGADNRTSREVKHVSVTAGRNVVMVEEGLNKKDSLFIIYRPTESNVVGYLTNLVLVLVDE